MIWNYLFIALIIVSAGYLLSLFWRQRKMLATINVERVPGVKDQQVKSRLLEAKLKRTIGEHWGNARRFIGWHPRKLSDSIKFLQQRLQQLEREYRRIIHKDLSSEVKKSKAIEDLLIGARTYLDQGEYAKAEEVLIDALSLNDHNVEAYFILARVYQGKKELDHARETLEYLLRLTHNEDPQVFEQMAALSLERGNLKEAEEEYLRSISLDENNYLYYFELAGIYRDMEELVQALEIAKKALVLAPNNPKILDFLIELAIAQQDKIEAKQYLERLMEVNPDNNKIEDFRQRIEG
ncbi:MAG: tetratricopeptide repeat protein [Candidatus Komeilibacteria bacterium]